MSLKDRLKILEGNYERHTNFDKLNQGSFDKKKENTSNYLRQSIISQFEAWPEWDILPDSIVFDEGISHPESIKQYNFEERFGIVVEALKTTKFNQLHIKVDLVNSGDKSLDITLTLPEGHTYFSSKANLETGYPCEFGEIVFKEGGIIRFGDRGWDGYYSPLDRAKEIPRYLDDFYKKMDATPEELMGVLSNQLGENIVKRFGDLFKKPDDAKYMEPTREAEKNMKIEEERKLRELFSLVQNYKGFESFESFKERYIFNEYYLKQRK